VLVQLKEQNSWSEFTNDSLQKKKKKKEVHTSVAEIVCLHPVFKIIVQICADSHVREHSLQLGRVFMTTCTLKEITRRGERVISFQSIQRYSYTLILRASRFTLRREIMLASASEDTDASKMSRFASTRE